MKDANASSEASVKVANNTTTNKCSWEQQWWKLPFGQRPWWKLPPVNSAKGNKAAVEEEEFSPKNQPSRQERCCVSLTKDEDLDNDKAGVDDIQKDRVARSEKSLDKKKKSKTSSAFMKNIVSSSGTGNEHCFMMNLDKLWKWWGVKGIQACIGLHV